MTREARDPLGTGRAARRTEKRRSRWGVLVKSSIEGWGDRLAADHGFANPLDEVIKAHEITPTIWKEARVNAGPSYHRCRESVEPMHRLHGAMVKRLVPLRSTVQ